MRNVRAALAAATTLILLAALISGPATADASGVGTSSAETAVVDVELGTDGELLSVQLLGDSARSTIDPAVASGAEAFSRITGVSVDSAVDALDGDSGQRESKDPGGNKQVTEGSINLSEPAPGVTVPDEVLSGTIGLTSLSSDATATKATSTVAASLNDATVAGALATVEGVSSTLEAVAANTASETSRSVTVDQVVVLDLGAFLAGLDLSILDLPVSTVTALLGTLGLDVEGVPAADVAGKVDDLNAAIDALQAQVDAIEATGLTGTTVGTVVDTVNNTPLGELIDSGTEATLATLADPDAVIDEVNGIVDDLQATLAKLLEDVAAVLDAAPLLSAEGVEVGVTTKAADTVENSSTSRTGTIGSITVGGVTIDGVDLLATVEELQAKVAEVTAMLDGALGAVDDDLASIVSVELLQPADGAGVGTADGYVKAVDGITALSATVDPPDELQAVIDEVMGAVSAANPALGTAIDAANGVDGAPDLSTTMDDLSAALGGAKSLGGGGTVKLASVQGTSQFKMNAAGGPGSGTGEGGPGGGGGGGAPAAGTPNEANRTLPATGRNSTLPLAALATFLIALGLGFREWVHMPVQPIRIRIRTR
jgi:hypothetical protein